MNRIAEISGVNAVICYEAGNAHLDFTTVLRQTKYQPHGWYFLLYCGTTTEGAHPLVIRRHPLPGWLQSRQFCRGHSSIMEPRHHFIIRQQDRHPVMDIDDSVIGGSCQNYKPFLPLKSVPKPGQIQPVLPRQPEMDFPLLTIPFVESGGGHDASPFQQGAAEYWLV